MTQTLATVLWTWGLKGQCSHVTRNNSGVIFFLRAEKWGLSNDDSCHRTGHRKSSLSPMSGICGTPLSRHTGRSSLNQASQTLSILWMRVDRKIPRCLWQSQTCMREVRKLSMCPNTRSYMKRIQRNLRDRKAEWNWNCRNQEEEKKTCIMGIRDMDPDRVLHANHSFKSSWEYLNSLLTIARL